MFAGTPAVQQQSLDAITLVQACSDSMGQAKAKIFGRTQWRSGGASPAGPR